MKKGINVCVVLPLIFRFRSNGKINVNSVTVPRKRNCDVCTARNTRLCLDWNAFDTNRMNMCFCVIYLQSKFNVKWSHHHHERTPFSHSDINWFKIQNNWTKLNIEWNIWSCAMRIHSIILSSWKIQWNNTLIDANNNHFDFYSGMCVQ